MALSSDGLRLGVGRKRNDNAGTNSGNVRIYDWDGSNWTPVGINLEGEAAGDRSGHSVSLSSDGSRIAIGAPENDGSGSDAGHVRVYEYTTSDEATAPADRLLASDAAAGDQLGRAVAASGDYMLAGAMHKGGVGRAYLYRYTSRGAWAQHAVLTASDANTKDHFGFAVDLHGDDAIVSAPRNGYGAAYLFRRDGDSLWSETAILRGTSTTGCSFGASVAIQDGYAIVAAPLYGASDSGAVYVFKYDGNTWNEQAILLASDAAANDRVGDVALSDGYAIVGVHLKDDAGGGVDHGAAYVFRRDNDEVWTQHAKLVASDGDPTDNFGYAVALAGEYAVLGAKRYDDPASAEQELSLSVQQNIDEYNCDVDADGVMDTLCVKWSSNPRTVPFIELEMPADFGALVTLNISGHWTDQGWGGTGHNGIDMSLRRADGTEYDKLRIESINHDNDPTYGDTPVNYVKRYHAPFAKVPSLHDLQPGDKIVLLLVTVSWTGWEIRAANTTIEITYTPAPPAATWGGAAYVFKRDADGAGWSEQAKLTADYAYDFGRSVDIAAGGDDGDDHHILVGARAVADGLGRAYVFRRDGEAWIEQTILTGDGTASAFEEFGFAAALTERRAIVGAAHHTAQGTATHSGAAYAFQHAHGVWRPLTADIVGFQLDLGAFSDGVNDAVDASGPYVKLLTLTEEQTHVGAWDGHLEPYPAVDLDPPAAVSDIQWWENRAGPHCIIRYTNNGAYTWGLFLNITQAQANASYKVNDIITALVASDEQIRAQVDTGSSVVVPTFTLSQNDDTGRPLAGQTFGTAVILASSALG